MLKKMSFSKKDLEHEDSVIGSEILDSSVIAIL